MTRRDPRQRHELELRVMVDGRPVIGPVQATLPEAIHETGSISAAHRLTGASYADVWKLVAAINAAFPPLVEPIRGGARGGGAMLTEGRKVLNSFRRLEDLSKIEGHAELLAIGNAVTNGLLRPE